MPLGVLRTTTPGGFELGDLPTIANYKKILAVSFRSAVRFVHKSPLGWKASVEKASVGPLIFSATANALKALPGKAVFCRVFHRGLRNVCAPPHVRFYDIARHWESADVGSNGGRSGIDLRSVPEGSSRGCSEQIGSNNS